MSTKEGWKKQLTMRMKQIGRPGERPDRLSEPLLCAEQRIENIRQVFCAIVKKLLSLLRAPSTAATDADKRQKKGNEFFLSKILGDSATLFNDDCDSLGRMLNLCSEAQETLAKALLEYESELETRVVAPIQVITEQDIPSIIKLRKQSLKLAQVVDADKSRLTTSQKQAVMKGNVSTISAKTDSLMEEVDESEHKLNACRDQLETEMYNFISRENELNRLLLQLVESQASYHQNSLASLKALIPQMRKNIIQCSRQPVYGCLLSDHLQRTKREIASVIEGCVQELMRDGINEEGLFRVASGSSKVKKLKAAFDANMVDWNDYCNDPHCVAGALKQYLRELPEPLLTFELYNDWMQAGQYPADQRVHHIAAVLRKMPMVYFVNLRYLMTFLSRLAENSDVNKMTAINIAIVIAPNLLWPPNSNGPNMLMTGVQSSVVETLVTHASKLFSTNIPSDVTTYTNGVSTRSPRSVSPTSACDSLLSCAELMTSSLPPFSPPRPQPVRLARSRSQVQKDIWCRRVDTGGSLRSWPDRPRTANSSNPSLSSRGNGTGNASVMARNRMLPNDILAGLSKMQSSADSIASQRSGSSTYTLLSNGANSFEASSTYGTGTATSCSISEFSTRTANRSCLLACNPINQNTQSSGTDSVTEHLQVAGMKSLSNLKGQNMAIHDTSARSLTASHGSRTDEHSNKPLNEGEILNYSPPLLMTVSVPSTTTGGINSNISSSTGVITECRWRPRNRQSTNDLLHRAHKVTVTPPKSVHSEVYDTLFALHTLKSNGGCEEYMNRVRTLWDTHMDVNNKRHSFDFSKLSPSDGVNVESVGDNVRLYNGQRKGDGERMVMSECDCKINIRRGEISLERCLRDVPCHVESGSRMQEAKSSMATARVLPNAVTEELVGLFDSACSADQLNSENKINRSAALNAVLASRNHTMESGKLHPTSNIVKNTSPVTISTETSSKAFVTTDTNSFSLHNSSMVQSRDRPNVSIPAAADDTIQPLASKLHPHHIVEYDASFRDVLFEPEQEALHVSQDIPLAQADISKIKTEFIASRALVSGVLKRAKPSQLLTRPSTVYDDNGSSAVQDIAYEQNSALNAAINMRIRSASDENEVAISDVKSAMIRPDLWQSEGTTCVDDTGLTETDSSLTSRWNRGLVDTNKSSKSNIEDAGSVGADLRVQTRCILTSNAVLSAAPSTVNRTINTVQNAASCAIPSHEVMSNTNCSLLNSSVARGGIIRSSEVNSNQTLAGSALTSNDAFESSTVRSISDFPAFATSAESLLSSTRADFANAQPSHTQSASAQLSSAQCTIAQPSSPLLGSALPASTLSASALPATAKPRNEHASSIISISSASAVAESDNRTQFLTSHTSVGADTMVDVSVTQNRTAAVEQISGTRPSGSCPLAVFEDDATDR